MSKKVEAIQIEWSVTTFPIIVIECFREI